MGKWGHDALSMEEWATKLEQNNTFYRDEVNNLYNIFGRFFNSPDFSGGLSENISEITEEQRPKYLSYEDIINDCIAFMRNRADNIQANTDHMVQVANNNNPIDDARDYTVG